MKFVGFLPPDLTPGPGDPLFVDDSRRTEVADFYRDQGARVVEMDFASVAAAAAADPRPSSRAAGWRRWIEDHDRAGEPIVLLVGGFHRLLQSDLPTALSSAYVFGSVATELARRDDPLQVVPAFGVPRSMWPSLRTGAPIEGE